MQATVLPFSLLRLCYKLFHTQLDSNSTQTHLIVSLYDHLLCDEHWSHGILIGINTFVVLKGKFITSYSLFCMWWVHFKNILNHLCSLYRVIINITKSMFTLLFQNDKQRLYHIHLPSSCNDQGLPGQAPGFAALSRWCLHRQRCIYR